MRGNVAFPLITLYILSGAETPIKSSAVLKV